MLHDPDVLQASAIFYVSKSIQLSKFRVLCYLKSSILRTLNFFFFGVTVKILLSVIVIRAITVRCE